MKDEKEKFCAVRGYALGSAWAEPAEETSPKPFEKTMAAIAHGRS
jgi:hypothetical protein